MYNEQPFTALEMLLLALWFISLLIAIWSYNAVLNEAERSAPSQFKEITIRFWLDQFIWSASASRKVRRQYVITMSCFILGLACLTAFIWGRYAYPMAMLPSLMLVIVTTTFAWKWFRH
jgi:hypothetical protein